MHPHAYAGEGIYCLAHVDGVATEAVELGDDKHIACFELVHQFLEAGSLADGDAAGNSLFDYAAWFHLEASGGNLLSLVFGALAGARNPAIGKDSGQDF